MDKKTAELLIYNKRDFDNCIWCAVTEFDENNYNQWLKYVVDKLQELYNMDVLEELPNYQYILGDIINMLRCIKFSIKND